MALHRSEQEWRRWYSRLPSGRLDMGRDQKSVRWYSVRVRWHSVRLRWYSVRVRWYSVRVRWHSVRLRWYSAKIGEI